MSTLFETYYDSFGHELHLGDIVAFRTGGNILYGSIVKFSYDKKGNVKYNVVPSAKYLEHGIELRHNYNVSERNIFLAKLKNK